MKLWHRHTFDPLAWKLVSTVHVGREKCIGGIVVDTMSIGSERVWSNTCKDCGDLIFRRSKEIE